MKFVHSVINSRNECVFQLIVPKSSLAKNSQYATSIVVRHYINMLDAQTILNLIKN